MTNPSEKIISRKIGMNRGARRIWIEGAILVNNNIQRGDRFDIITSPNSIVILLNPEGSRKVSGKAEKPIIDMAGATITDAFADHTTHVRIDTIKEGMGTGIILTGLPVEVI